MTKGLMTFSIITLIIMVITTVPPAITLTAPIESGGIEITPVATPEIQSVSLAAQNAHDTPSTPPAIKVIFYPFSVNGDTNLTIKWEVSGDSLIAISHTAVHWGYKSANISDYPRVSNIQTGKTPQEFRVEIRAPAGGDFYFRTHAVVEGINVYSPEYQIRIIAPMGEGGGKTISGDATKFPIAPTPELNTIILILTGLLGILLVSRKN